MNVVYSNQFYALHVQDLYIAWHSAQLKNLERRNTILEDILSSYSIPTYKLATRGLAIATLSVEIDMYIDIDADP